MQIPCFYDQNISFLICHMHENLLQSRRKNNDISYLKQNCIKEKYSVSLQSLLGICIYQFRSPYFVVERYNITFSQEYKKCNFKICCCTQKWFERFTSKFALCSSTRRTNYSYISMVLVVNKLFGKQKFFNALYDGTDTL